jgi:hypothetical protein
LFDPDNAAMKLMIVPVTPFQQNCSILVDETTGQAVAIDPGGDLDRIDEALKTAGGKLEKVLLTHGHTAPLVRVLQQRGIDAGTLRTEFAGEDGSDAEAEADASP